MVIIFTFILALQCKQHQMLLISRVFDQATVIMRNLTRFMIFYMIEEINSVFFLFIAVIRAAIVRHLRTTQVCWPTSIQIYLSLELTMIRQAWVSTCQRAFYSWSLCSYWSLCLRLTFGAISVRLPCPDGMIGAWTTNCTPVWWFFSLVTCWKLRFVFICDKLLIHMRSKQKNLPF